VAAITFLIASSGMASAEVEDIGRPATAFPDDVARGPGLIRDGDGFALRPWRGNFTSLSVGGKIISSLGSDIGAPPDGQAGAGPFPTSLGYESNADYSSSTLDVGLFPATVTDFGSVDSMIWKDPTIFGGHDQVAGFDFFVNASGSWSSGPSDFDIPSEDRTRKRRSGHCSSEVSTSSVIHCETEEDLASFMTTSPGAGSDAADWSGLQTPNFPGPNPPFGGAYLSTLWLEKNSARNNFAITIQGTFPPTCGACDATPPVGGAFAPTSDFVDPNGSSNFNQGLDPGGTSLGDLGVTQPAPSVPEIPPPVMLLIGFAGLALIGRHRPWRSARLG
jgi:hypothetical protein